MEMCQDYYSQKSGLSNKNGQTTMPKRLRQYQDRKEAVEVFVLTSHSQKEWLLTTYTGRVGYQQRGR